MCLLLLIHPVVFQVQRLRMTAESESSYPETIYQGATSIQDLELDCVEGYLYWTTYQTIEVGNGGFYLLVHFQFCFNGVDMVQYCIIFHLIEQKMNVFGS